MLIDRFGRVHRYLRLSVTDRCNLRCAYCFPQASGYEWKPREEILTYEEIQRIVAIFAHLGIEKIRITGGEPLLRHNLPLLVNNLASIEGIKHIGLTTNGILLARLAEELKEAGVNSINVSLDTLRPDRYQRLTGLPLYYQVRQGIDKILILGFNPVKINCVVIRGFNEDEIDDFMMWIQEAPIEVRFIEFMPFQGTSWKEWRVVTGLEIESYLRKKYPIQPILSSNENLTSEQNNPFKKFSSVANTYQIEGFQGKVGLITPLSSHFCGNCDRLRLTAEGGLKTCLFSAPEVNLRDHLRAGVKDESIIQIIQQSLASKPQSHPNPEEIKSHNAFTMIAIGG